MLLRFVSFFPIVRRSVLSPREKNETAVCLSLFCCVIASAQCLYRQRKLCPDDSTPSHEGQPVKSARAPCPTSVGHSNDLTTCCSPNPGLSEWKFAHGFNQRRPLETPRFHFRRSRLEYATSRIIQTNPVAPCSPVTRKWMKDTDTVDLTEMACSSLQPLQPCLLRTRASRIRCASYTTAFKGQN